MIYFYKLRETILIDFTIIASFYFTAAKRNHIDRILSEMDRRNTEIQDTLMAMKSMMADACKVIGKLNL